jgi:cytochrome c6
VRKFFAIVLIVFIGCSVNFQSLAIAAEMTDGAKIFNTNCAGCHVNGGNIIRRNKNLKLKALQKNKMDSLVAIQEIVTNGKNNMSAYRDRLSQEEIEVVSTYVLEQAKNNWKS